MMSNIFNIFSIDWWMDESNNALQMTDSVLFLIRYETACRLHEDGGIHRRSDH